MNLQFLSSHPVLDERILPQIPEATSSHPPLVPPSCHTFLNHSKLANVSAERTIEITETTVQCN